MGEPPKADIARAAESPVEPRTMTGERDGLRRGGAGVWSRYSAVWGMFTRSSLRRLVVPCVHDHVFGPLARKPFRCLITMAVSLTTLCDTRK